jgi:hypothetical protein
LSSHFAKRFIHKSAVDNIDHIPSATTATTSFHGTHTQDGGFERDSRDQTCSFVFVGSVDLVLISRMLVLHLCNQYFIINVVTKEETIVSNKAIDTDFIAP